MEKLGAKSVKQERDLFLVRENIELGFSVGVLHFKISVLASMASKTFPLLPNRGVTLKVGGGYVEFRQIRDL